MGYKFPAKDVSKLHMIDSEIYQGSLMGRLLTGTATEKEIYYAQRLLYKINAALKRPMSREESYDVFVAKKNYEEPLRLINNRIVIMRKTFERLGLIGPDEINKTIWLETAAGLPDLCDTCELNVAICKAAPKYAINLEFGSLMDLTDPQAKTLSDKIVECSIFKDREAVFMRRADLPIPPVPPPVRKIREGVEIVKP